METGNNDAKDAHDSDWESRAIEALKYRNRGLMLVACVAMGLAVGWIVWKTSGEHPSKLLDAPFVLELNHATEAELHLLPGIGPKSVEAILTYRKAHGGFTHVDELKNIPGIKDGRLKALLPYITVDASLARPNHAQR